MSPQQTTSTSSSTHLKSKPSETVKSELAQFATTGRDIGLTGACGGDVREATTEVAQQPDERGCAFASTHGVGQWREAACVCDVGTRPVLQHQSTRGVRARTCCHMQWVDASTVGILKGEKR